MNSVNWAATFLAFSSIGAHLISILIVLWRFGRSKNTVCSTQLGLGVSVIRTVCGLDHYDEATLGSTFRLAHPNLEIIFCAAQEQDSCVPLVRRLIADHPFVSARLLIGNDRIGENPKLNNMVKGWRAAAYDWIVFVDSNVLMPSDYIERLLSKLEIGASVVSSPPVGVAPVGFWAELECAYLNTYQLRWQYAADALGFGFVQGKSIFLQRSVFDKAGGLRSLAAEIAEDAATTKIARGAGLRITLVDPPFSQPIGYRTFTQVWHRQLRWARSRRATFKLFYVPEIFSGALLPLSALLVAILPTELSAASVLVYAASIWYGAEAILAIFAGWPLSWHSPFSWFVRDLMLPALWIGGWISNGFVWRGNSMNVAQPSEQEEQIQMGA